MKTNEHLVLYGQTNNFYSLKIGTNISIVGISPWNGLHNFCFSFGFIWQVCITVLLPLLITGKGGSGQNIKILRNVGGCVFACVHTCTPAPWDSDGLLSIGKGPPSGIRRGLPLVIDFVL